MTDDTIVEVLIRVDGEEKWVDAEELRGHLDFLRFKHEQRRRYAEER